MSNKRKLSQLSPGHDDEKDLPSRPFDTYDVAKFAVLRKGNNNPSPPSNFMQAPDQSQTQQQQQQQQQQQRMPISQGHQQMSMNNADGYQQFKYPRLSAGGGGGGGGSVVDSFPDDLLANFEQQSGGMYTDFLTQGCLPDANAFQQQAPPPLPQGNGGGGGGVYSPAVSSHGNNIDPSKLMSNHVSMASMGGQGLQLASASSSAGSMMMPPQQQVSAMAAAANNRGNTNNPSPPNNNNMMMGMGVGGVGGPLSHPHHSMQQMLDADSEENKNFIRLQLQLQSQGMIGGGLGQDSGNGGGGHGVMTPEILSLLEKQAAAAAVVMPTSNNRQQQQHVPSSSRQQQQQQSPPHNNLPPNNNTPQQHPMSPPDQPMQPGPHQRSPPCTTVGGGGPGPSKSSSSNGNGNGIKREGSGEHRHNHHNHNHSHTTSNSNSPTSSQDEDPLNTSDGPSASSGKIVPDSEKDDAYWEKRRKNNESAKRSREARRLKESQISIQVIFLEQENIRLRTEVELVSKDIAGLEEELRNRYRQLQAEKQLNQAQVFDFSRGPPPPRPPPGGTGMMMQ